MLPPTGGGTEATTVATTTRGPNNGNIVPSLVGAFTQDAIMQRILMQYLTPQVAQALMNRDIQGARSIAMAAARVGNQDAEQRRQATEALTHFFDYLAQEEPTR
jgi:O-acetyl-ADP-ribose deacetylase (regulator of RNase III)